MLIYLLSELLCLFSELCCVAPYLLYMFPAVLFIVSGGWINFIILLYCATLSYDTIKIPVVRLIWYLYSALPSSPYFRSHLSESINITLSTFSPWRSQSMDETMGDTPLLLHLPFLLYLPLLLQATYNSSSEF